MQGGVQLRQHNYRDWKNSKYERPYGNNRRAAEKSIEEDPCNGEDYCEDVDDYPHEAAMQVAGYNMSQGSGSWSWFLYQMVAHFTPY